MKELLGHKTNNMTNRYAHLAQEHKAQAVAKLTERFEPQPGEAQAHPVTVSEESKQALRVASGQAINAVSPLNLEQNRNIFLVRRGRGLGIFSDIKREAGIATDSERPQPSSWNDLS